MFSLTGTNAANLTFIYFLCAYDILTASSFLIPFTVGKGYEVQSWLKALG
jgi:hypothetical protein